MNTPTPRLFRTQNESEPQPVYDIVAGIVEDLKTKENNNDDKQTDSNKNN